MSPWPDAGQVTRARASNPYVHGQHRGEVDFMGNADDLIGRTLEMAALVDYQDGSVVSRTIIERDTGTVTLFAFGAGQGLSEHTTPYDALVHVVDGVARVTIASEEHSVEAGQMLIMPADVPHALQADEPFKMLLVMIRQ